MPADLCIRGGRVVTADSVAEMDITIEAGRIIAVGEAQAAREEIDATGLHVFPGVIDPHVHFNEPGRTDWEGFDTGSAALAAGGGTCFFDMPLNSDPPLLDGAAFDAKLAAAEAHSRTDFAFWGGLTPLNLDRMEELAERGVIGFKAFMCDSGIAEFPMADDLTLLRGMERAAAMGLPVAVHAESEAITSRLTAEARERGGKSWRDYLDSRPIIAEVEAVSRAITLAAETGCKLHIVHISSSRAVECVESARERDGVDVTCETCPHYLRLTDDDLAFVGGAYKCSPPLRSAAEVERLWDHLIHGRFAFVASDHSPCPPAMKQGDDAFDIWGGISGVQSTLNVLLNLEPSLALPLVAALTSTHVAERFTLASKGQIKPGFDADLALIDVEAAFKLTEDSMRDRHKLSPYLGATFWGVVRRTIVRGHSVLHDGRLAGGPLGRLLKPRL